MDLKDNLKNDHLRLHFWTFTVFDLFSPMYSRESMSASDK